MGHQRLGRCDPGRCDRREDPATRLEDLEIAGAPLPEEQLALTRAGEHEMGMRIDETRCHGAAAGVKPREPPQRIALGLERRLDRSPWPDRDDPAVPAGHDRRGRRAGTDGSAARAETTRGAETTGRPRCAESADRARTDETSDRAETAAPDHPARTPGLARRQPPDLALRRPAANASRHRDDLARADDEQPWRRFVASTALDDAESARAHFPLGPDRAASSRSSSACIGEKSRNRR